MSVNKVILLGRLGQDPEIKYTGSGQAVTSFSLATSESWTDKATGQKQEKTEWSKVVVWGKLAELCNQYLSKGRQAYIEGKLATRAWDDKDGVKRYTTEIVANTVQFIGGNPALQDGQQQAGVQGGVPGNSNNPRGGSTNLGNHNSNVNTPPPEDFSNVHTDASFAADDIPF